jgi:hypothetical protein
MYAISILIIFILSCIVALLKWNRRDRRLPSYVCYNFLQTLAHHRIDLPHETRHLYDFDKSAVFDPSTVTSRANVVFVKTDLLDDFVDRDMQNIRVPFVLVTGNSDLSPSEHGTDAIVAYPMVLQWASTNVHRRHESPITRGMPIGLSEPDRPIGDQYVISRCMSKIRVKKNRVLLPPCGNTHPVRAKLQDFEHRLVDRLNGPKMSFEKYLDTMAEYRWIICPRGNGIDVHRVWESLLLRSIPIYVADSYDTVPLVYKEFPMIVVSTIEDLPRTLDRLEAYDINWEAVRKALTLSSYAVT